MSTEKGNPLVDKKEKDDNSSSASGSKRSSMDSEETSSSSRSSGGPQTIRTSKMQGDGGTLPPIEEEGSEHFDVSQFVPPQEIKTVVLSKRKSKKNRTPGPIASKVVFLKKPEELFPEPETQPDVEGGDAEKEEGQPGQPGVGEQPETVDADEEYHDKEPETRFVDDIMLLFEDRLPEDNEADKLIDLKLTQLIDIHRGEVMRKVRKSMKARQPKFPFSKMLEFLNKEGIPCPINEDYGRLYGNHSRWDPDGTVVKYFSPMLRTFIPVNMRGRYRGSWNTDDCVKGLDISQVPPKRDALDGFVERGRHNSIQEKYDDMSSVAIDEAHLDYLIEIQTYQAQTLPIPIFYDMLHLGMEVANENLRIFVQEQGYPPNNPIFTSAQDHAEQLRRKIQLYGALGLEMLESKRKGLGQYSPQWLKTRDEVIRQIMKHKDNERYEQLQKLEQEANEREQFRREAIEKEMDKRIQEQANRSAMKEKEGWPGINKVYPEQQQQQQ